MPLKKLPESRWVKSVDHCQHPEHNPPGMIVLEPGTYEYTCPSCGARQYFVVPARPECCA